MVKWTGLCLRVTAADIKLCGQRRFTSTKLYCFDRYRLVWGCCTTVSEPDLSITIVTRYRLRHHTTPGMAHICNWLQRLLQPAMSRRYVHHVLAAQHRISAHTYYTWTLCVCFIQNLLWNESYFMKLLTLKRHRNNKSCGFLVPSQTWVFGIVWINEWMKVQWFKEAIFTSTNNWQ